MTYILMYWRKSLTLDKYAKSSTEDKNLYGQLKKDKGLIRGIKNLSNVTCSSTLLSFDGSVGLRRNIRVGLPVAHILE